MNPWARWTFDTQMDENAGNQGERVGPFKTGIGIFGEALVFDGNGFINADKAPASIAAKPYTITAWIKTTAGGRRHRRQWHHERLCVADGLSQRPPRTPLVRQEQQYLGRKDRH